VAADDKAAAGKKEKNICMDATEQDMCAKDELVEAHMSLLASWSAALESSTSCARQLQHAHPAAATAHLSLLASWNAAASRSTSIRVHGSRYSLFAHFCSLYSRYVPRCGALVQTYKY